MIGSFNLGVFVLCVLFTLVVKSHIQVWHSLITVLCALLSCFIDNAILLLLFVANVLYVHCVCVDCNTVYCIMSYQVNAHKVMYLFHPKQFHV